MLDLVDGTSLARFVICGHPTLGSKVLSFAPRFEPQYPDMDEHAVSPLWKSSKSEHRHDSHQQLCITQIFRLCPLLCAR